MKRLDLIRLRPHEEQRHRQHPHPKAARFTTTPAVSTKMAKQDPLINFSPRRRRNKRTIRDIRPGSRDAATGLIVARRVGDGEVRRQGDGADGQAGQAPPKARASGEEGGDQTDEAEGQAACTDGNPKDGEQGEHQRDDAQYQGSHPQRGQRDVRREYATHDSAPQWPGMNGTMSRLK
jgi:hypothetical protein